MRFINRFSLYHVKQPRPKQHQCVNFPDPNDHIQYIQMQHAQSGAIHRNHHRP